MIENKIDDYLGESSSAFAVERFNELHKLLMDENVSDKLEQAGMKTKKEAAKIFQQAISLLKGLK